MRKKENTEVPPLYRGGTSGRSADSKVGPWSGILVVLAVALVCCGFATPRRAEAAPLIRAASNLGLAGYWPMNEGVGTVAGDFSGNGNNGTLTNGPSWVAGKNGKAIRFDGVNDVLVLPANSTITSGVSAATASSWIRVEGSTTSIVSLISISIDNGGVPTNISRFALDMNPDRTIRCGGRSNDGEALQSVDTVVPLEFGKWQHVVCIISYATNSISIYFDGALQTTTGTPAFADTLTDATPSTVSALGASDDAILSFFPGSLDDVRIYRRALSVSEIMNLARTGGVTRRTISNVGLIGYWPLDEGGGSQAGDFSGNGNTGTIVGSVPWVNGRRGGAFDFNGSAANRVSIPDSASLSNFASSTFMAWIRVRSWPGVGNAYISNLLGDENVGGANQYTGTWRIGSGALLANQRRFAMNISNGSGLQDVIADADLPLDRWVHVAATVDGSNVRFYYDGVPQGVTAQTVQYHNAATANWFINSRGGSDRPFDGLIDDIRLYNRPLSATEIQALAQGGQTRGSRTPTNLVSNGLVGYWPFDGRFMNWTTNQALDASGGGNNGTLVGFSTTTSAVPGRVGQSVRFSGVLSNGVTVSNESNFDFVGAVSAAAWIKLPPAGFTNGFQMIVGKGDTSWRLQRYSTTNQIEFGLSGTLSSPYFSASNIPADEWTHVAATYDGANVRFYINGALDATRATGGGTLATNNTNVSVGTNLDIASREWVGELDEVRVYNRAITDTEVRQLFQAGR